MSQRRDVNDVVFDEPAIAETDAGLSADLDTGVFTGNRRNDSGVGDALCTVDAVDAVVCRVLGGPLRVADPAQGITSRA